MTKKNKNLSRRDFLKIGTLTSSAIGLSPYLNFKQKALANSSLQGRITYESISIFDKPLINGAETIGYLFRDEIVDIVEEITAIHGPANNPLWYRIKEGYIHSKFVQAFEEQIETPLENISEEGDLAELRMAFVEPYTFSESGGWTPIENSRLYYESTHWVVDAVEGPDKEIWYALESELWRDRKFYAPAKAFHIFSESELSPIHTEVPKDNKYIVVSLRWQMLQAFEGEKEVMRTMISSGINSNSTNGISTLTPTGTHYVQSKMPSKHMGSGSLVNASSNEDLPGVPWTMFFDDQLLGYAIHGAYWHHNFGVQMSKGCVNMFNPDAKWLFRWATPELPIHERASKTLGTRIVII
jgi:lipoprotein-anchoring transpeptidase ErfK/SrfK